ncbi:MAG: hypothetical protein VX899_05335 [Myxococcota bacterium]|nr:hypothetical protein [Myxococcota bacterium]
MRLVPFSRLVLPAMVFGALAAAGCVERDDRFNTTNGETEGDSDTDTDADSDTDADADGDADSDTDADSDPVGELDEPGDLVTFTSEDEYVDLSDASGDSNQDQDFFLIVINNGEGDAGYTLRYSDASQLGGDTGGPGGIRIPSGPQQAPAKLQRPAAGWQPLSEPVAPPAAYEVGVSRQSFRVRNDFEDSGSYAKITATLWGLGDSVAIWVDDDVAIDWDQGCDGTLDEVDPRGSYGLDNCDLQDVANIVDTNIFANINATMGEPSDLNGDGLVSVVISPWLNKLPLGSSDEDDFTQVVPSYANPEVDLADYDATANPGSNEQEVIFVFAPDPYGFFNSYYTATVESYTEMTLAAEIARSYTNLALYNYRVLEAESSMEDTWLIETLGTAAADSVGFGAVYYDDAWKYLDAPYLYSLSSYEDDGIIATDPRGAQYLFGRWLVDAFGVGVLSEIVQLDAGSLGESSEENVATAVSTVSGEEWTFGDLVLAWQIALLTTGVEAEDGSELVDSAVWTPYAASAQLSAPDVAPSTPTPGVYYGANGYQTGFNVRGLNQFFTAGTTASPTEADSKGVRTAGPDFHTFVPDFDFHGYTAGSYGVHVVRLSRLNLERAALEIDTEGTLSGAVVRWPGSGEDIEIERVFSALDQSNLVPIPELPQDGSPVYGMGEISESFSTRVIEDDDTVGKDVEDTDRWLLDLSARPTGQVVPVVVQLDRRFENSSGDEAPYDPWLAILPAEALSGVLPADWNSGTCAESSESWAFPNTVLSYQYYQLFTSSVAFTEEEMAEDFCAETTAELGCGDDYELDGVANEDELEPASFLDQLWTVACKSGGEASVDTSIFDLDERDDNDDFTYSPRYNLGGRSGASGEEATLTASLVGGEQYVIIVSGGGDQGSYELQVQQVEQAALDALEND